MIAANTVAGLVDLEKWRGPLGWSKHDSHDVGMAKLKEILRLWDMPEYGDCKTVGEVAARHATLTAN